MLSENLVHAKQEQIKKFSTEGRQHFLRRKTVASGCHKQSGTLCLIKGLPPVCAKIIRGGASPAKPHPSESHKTVTTKLSSFTLYISNLFGIR